MKVTADEALAMAESRLRYLVNLDDQDITGYKVCEAVEPLAVVLRAILEAHPRIAIVEVEL